VKVSDPDKHLADLEEARLRARASYLTRRGKTYPKYRKMADKVRTKLAALRKNRQGV
jgi:hypothetical protein